MASNKYAPQNPSSSQPIPLQDLTRPPDSQDASDGKRRHSRRATLRESILLRDRESIGSRRGFSTRYEAIEDHSPSPWDRDTKVPVTQITTPSGTHQSPYIDDAGETSPLENRGGFQEAMGFAGLSFHGDTSIQPPPLSSPPLRDRYGLGVVTQAEGLNPYSNTIRESTEEGSSYFSPTDTDTTPLNDARHQQPMSGGLDGSPSGQPHDRISLQSVRFNTLEESGARLGDDLPNLEAGLYRSGGSMLDRSPSRSVGGRSLSPSAAGSPLTRAGSMVRKMSQRVVNLSNEPDYVEQSIRRNSSVKQSRLDGPPSFPAMTEYAHDAPSRTPSPIEKAPPLRSAERSQAQWQQQVNPLEGNSLMMFSPNNPLRTKLCDLLVHPATEPTILILIVIQTILLTIDSAPNVFNHPRPTRWGGSKIDWALFSLFVVYTLELIARSIVSGFIVNAEKYSTIDRRKGFLKAVIENIHSLMSPQGQQPKRQQTTSTTESQQPSIVRSFTSMQAQMDQPGHTQQQQQRVRLARRAFMRHSFNRLDLLAVTSFWISFGLSLAGLEAELQFYLFRMLSCLRILRLLGFTSGTSVILRSLKKAAPLLVNVAFLIGFFWLLFAIIGVQSFKSSLRRSCVWFDPEGIEPYVINNSSGTLQFCGGHLDNITGAEMPWLLRNPDTGILENGTTKHKGFLCPKNSFCIQGDNPYNGTVSFDNVPQSLELVFVIMSSNTFSDLLYYTTESDYLAAALFFAAGIVIMSLWLTNLLVAVITSSFQVIREESKNSAFAAQNEEHSAVGVVTPGNDDTLPGDAGQRHRNVSTLKKTYDKSSWIWIAVIIYGLVCQCLRSANMGSDREQFITVSETSVTLVLLVEILIRFAVDWRYFSQNKRNWMDLGLAIITTVIQLPEVRNSGQAYAWLTIFQILRIYRVVLAVPLTRKLIMVVLGNVGGLLNLIIFVFLITFLTAIFAVQIFRGQIPQQDQYGNTVHITFSDIYNGFIGMYQVLSSENWTLIMYNVTTYNVMYNTAWIGAAFFVLWFILANFIVINMFIAVIQENFDVTEDEKRLQQVKAYLQRKELGGSSHGNLSLSKIFRLGRDSHRKDPLDYGPATTEMLLKDAVVRDFLDDQLEPLNPQVTDATLGDPNIPEEVKPGALSALWGKFTGLVRNQEPNPFYSRLQFSRAYEDLDPRTMAQEVVSATEQRKRAQRDYLRKHPTYNDSLFLFRPSNPIRRYCQYVVGPGRGGQRFNGVEPNKAVWYTFSAFIYVAIVAMVLLACVTTPLYQRGYFQNRSPSATTWFVWADFGFAILFTIEAIIKVIADGFFWTPNAYFRGSWGFIDGLVLVTLWINVGTSLHSENATSRAIGAFKALRALRLLNVSDSARDTFHSVIVIGGWKVISAAFVSLSLLFPFAIYGLNLFNGQMLMCNDQNSNIANLTDCVGEFNSTPFNWEVLAPREVSNPYYDFDSFSSSLFILFQIVSQEGWTDVMWSAEMITGRGQQPQAYASQGNALFFIAFNLLGAVFVLTLFVSVFMRNYTEQTGVAFLTAEQRSWLELRKLLRQISPSKRPSNKRDAWWRKWCYRRAVKKHGNWQRFVTTVLCFHLALLVIEFYPDVAWWDLVRDYLFLACTIVYIINILIRIIGLTWTRFSKSSWDMYSILAVSGTLVTTILALAAPENNIYGRLHKYFLVSIALLLIPRNNQLDQLFKTAAASLTAIGNLLATWVVLFLVYAIALTQTFGLTRFGSNENGNLNFRTVPKALILLFRMSCGEGWNQIMEDFATINAPYCVVGDSFFESDCGSQQWARALFISWNILSMYIFVSLFVSLIFESFSYVYQRSSGLSSISREEIRRFKQAWSTFDPDGIGYISKESFPRLLGELSGVFEMRIYNGEHTVRNILEDCTVSQRNSDVNSGVVDGVDLKKLAKRLSQIPVDEIRERRKRLNRFYEEVLVSADPDQGIAFNSVLMIIAHYNVISDNKSLRLEEYLRRRARLQRVEEAVRRNVVIGFFDTMYWSRQFRKALESQRSARMTGIPQLDVPEIFVDDEDDIATAQRNSDPSSTTPIAMGDLWRHASGSDTSPIRSRLRSRGESRPVSPTGSERYNVSPQLSPCRPSYQDGGSYDADWQLSGGTESAVSGGGRSRHGSSVSRQDVLDVLDNSAWGESIRRSFTMRRSGGRSHEDEHSR
ncbi:MAG: calcium channel protein [Pycnora praestabilis]|nr:MAG: calcium channel protein [Pycnora praestabilis]